MSNRELPSWLAEFVQNTKWGEAPPHFYFWVGIGTIAAALRRQVWLPMGTFAWFPNLYILLVAPAGVVQKSTTADLGLTRLLKKIPGIDFGPSTFTWQALYDAFQSVGREVEVSPTEIITQHALVVNSPEFGITLNPKDTEMIDQLVHIWDGREMFKRTRKDGELIIPTPCLNLMACTTPDWIAENMSRYHIGGGLASRMVFVYGESKANLLAYPFRHLPPDYLPRVEILTRDLERISKLVGPFSLTPEALSWGEKWYEDFHTFGKNHLDPIIFGGYIARKQCMIHKVAMCMSASEGDSKRIELKHLQAAEQAVSFLEKDMPKVFAKIGSTRESLAQTKILEFISRQRGVVKWNILYSYVLPDFPNPQDAENILRGLIEAGFISIDKKNQLVSLTEKKWK